MKLKKLLTGIICLALILCLSVLPPFEAVVNASGESTVDPLKNVLSDGTLRRPVGPDAPMYIVHVDTWVTPDPQAVVELIPEDILPYCVFNISLSVSGLSATSAQEEGLAMTVEYGYETAKSWLRTLAELNCWAMIQPASGGPCHFPDYGLDTDLEETLFGEFFREYPNFIGFNYCEQFWGYEQEGFVGTCAERYTHFANLLELTNKYGGYLVVSWCGNQWSPGINPIAMLKTVPEWEEACKNYHQNFILCEKYTQHSYIADMESLVLGIYLSGYCDNFGIRYDDTGWTSGTGDDYVMATGLPIYFERMVLNGATVIDGPELTFQDCILEGGSAETEDGLTTRTWYKTSQFDNVAMDSFRKMIDGTFRIPSREEVIERTKVIIVNDVTTGDIDNQFSIPVTLTEGLYRMEGDGNLRDNYNLYKSTGRYPTVPMCHTISDDVADLFDVVVYKSDYKNYWKTVNDKVDEFNSLFDEQYTGDLYAAHNDNVWVTYNPYKANQTASANIPLQYNTCDSLDLEYSRYTTGVIKETADKLSIYLNNYDENHVLKARTDVIVINGASSEPSITYTDRGLGTLNAKVNTTWANGAYTIEITHNGAVQLEIECAGNAAGRAQAPAEVKMSEPVSAPDYYGTMQHEVEYFEYSGVKEILKNASRHSVDFYTAQGFVILGDQAAELRETVEVHTPGTYNLQLRYSCDSDYSGLSMYVNGKKVDLSGMVATLSLEDWLTASADVRLKEGTNKIVIKTKSGQNDLYLDNFTLEPVSYSASGSSGSLLYIVIGIAAVILIACAVVVISVLKKK